MNTEENNQGAGDQSQNGAGEGNEQRDVIEVPKADYDKLNETLGSLKREIKDLKKPKEETKETPKNQSEDSALLQKLERISLRTAGITHPDDIELAKKTAKKWGMDIDEVITDDDFKAKLERQQTTRSNELATTGIRSGGTTKSSNLEPSYWLSLGRPPTREEVGDRKVRAKIARAFIEKGSSNGKTFYND